MGVAYGAVGSCLIAESERGIWRAGSRCPDLTLTSRNLADGQRQQRIYSLAQYGRFLVVVVGGASNGDVQALQQFRHVADVLVLVHPAEGAMEGAIDDDGSSRALASDLVAPADSFTALVRPDMYIGYVGDTEGVQQYLSNLFS